MCVCSGALQTRKKIVPAPDCEMLVLRIHCVNKVHQTEELYGTSVASVLNNWYLYKISFSLAQHGVMDLFLLKERQLCIRCGFFLHKDEFITHSLNLPPKQ